MTLKIAQTPPVPAPATAYSLPDLPTFPLEAGFREIYDPETEEYHQVPLTLLDFLYPAKEDIGVVIMPESPWHDIWTKLLAIMLRSYLAGRDWLILSDVLIHWGRPGAPPKGPDLAAIPGGHLPAASENSYRVGRDGPMPLFVAELTSVETRRIDLQEKPLVYAAVGVKELLIIDLLPKGGSPWQLVGYRLEDTPFYRKIEPDEEGGLSFETVGLRFVVVGQIGVEVYDLVTGERLLTPDELKARAEAEMAARATAEARAEAEMAARVTVEARAEAEMAARVTAEAHAAGLAARLRELEARYGLQPVDQPTGDPQPDDPSSL